MKTLGMLAAVVVVGAGSRFGYSRLTHGDGASAFMTREVDRGDVIQTVSATGTIEPVTKVIVGSEVSGKIHRWYTDFNAVVKEGDLLAELETDRFVTAVQQAEADLALARAREAESLVRHKDAARERARIEKLADAQNASENELLVAVAAEEAARAVWQGAQASVKSAEAILGAVQVDLARTKIRSPIDGVVISRTIDVGQTVAASLQAPELFIIANDLKHMQVNANVAESDIGLIQEGGPAIFTVDAYPKRTFTGKISQIRYNATIVDGVVTYVTLIEVFNDDLALRPGMTANVTFEVAKAAGALRVPNAALRFDPNPPAPGTAGMVRGKIGKPRVYIPEKGSAKPIEVETGLSDGVFTEVRGDGVKEGMLVITDRAMGGPGGGGRPDPSRSMRPPRG